MVKIVPTYGDGMLMQAMAILGSLSALISVIFAIYCLYKWRTEWRHW